MSTTTSNDQDLLDLLRKAGPLSIEQLVKKVGVTATAIRHRLNRMMAGGLVDRSDMKRGRGRPSHEYKLSKKGLLAAGNNLADLASVIWDEVQSIADEAVRKSIISGVAERLSKVYRGQIEGDSISDRLASVAELFGKKNVPFVTEDKGGKTVLKIVGCPYPDLTNENREICEMERELLSKLAGVPLVISEHVCDCDGNYCTFEAEQPPVKISS